MTRIFQGRTIIQCFVSSKQYKIWLVTVKLCVSGSLSNGAINHFQWPWLTLTYISRSWYFQRLVTRKWYKIAVYLQSYNGRVKVWTLSNGAIFIDLEWLLSIRYDIVYSTCRKSWRIASFSLSALKTTWFDLWCRYLLTIHRHLFRSLLLVKPEVGQIIVLWFVYCLF